MVCAVSSEVVRVDRLRGDAEVHQLALAVDPGCHEAAACGSGHLGVGQFLLGIHELFLHLLRRGEQLLHVQLAVRVHFAPNGCCRRTVCVGPGGCSARTGDRPVMFAAAWLVCTRPACSLNAHGYSRRRPVRVASPRSRR